MQAEFRVAVTGSKKMLREIRAGEEGGEIMNGNLKRAQKFFRESPDVSTAAELAAEVHRVDCDTGINIHKTTT